MKKVLLITNIPTPYRIPLFNELNRQLQKKKIKLKVIFGALGYPRRKWKIDISEFQFGYEVLNSKRIQLSDPEKSIFIYSGLNRIIKREKPFLLISNGFSIATMKVWLFSLFHKTMYIIWSGATQIKDKPDSFLKRVYRTILIKRACGFIAYGSKAKEYLVSLGANPETIQISINTVDTEFFRKETKKLRNANAGEEKKRRNLLCIGYLFKRKGVDELLNSIYTLSQQRSDFILNIVGEGPEMDNLKMLAQKLDITDYVSFKGYQQKNDLIIFLSQADCFLFPSKFDIWGLVLVEAMAAGLPCIASIHAGATYDLIENGKTGFVMDFSQTREVTEKIDWILCNADLSKNIGENASRFIEKNINIRESAMGFVKMIIEYQK